MVNLHAFVGAVLAISMILTFCLNLGWLVYCIMKFRVVFKKYQTCKRTPNLHPIHRDVQYLSQQRKLYNLKTHLVKYALIVLCASVELTLIVWLVITQIIQSKLKLNSKQIASINEIKQAYPNCSFNHILSLVYFVPSSIFVLNMSYLLIFLLFVCLSILTRYLAARYFNHPFRTILIKYLVWLSVQFLIVCLCSTKYTLAFSFILFPLLSIINWLVLLRDNRLLSRNLKSHLREIKLFGNSKTLYREQLSAFRFYRIFQKILLVSFFFLSLSGIFYPIFQACYIFLELYCILNVVYGYNISIDSPYIHPSYTKFIQQEYGDIIESIFACIYSLSTLFPLILITLFPLIHGCFKRYKYRNIVYRYNYENMQPLMRRHY